MTKDKRIENEIIHGEYIKEHGEEIWNWSSPAGKIRWARRCRLFKELSAITSNSSWKSVAAQAFLQKNWPQQITPSLQLTFPMH